jgi:hypothetical protein
MADPTAGEVGGVLAGIVAALVALGHGIRWWLGWTDRRAITRAAKLDAWQRELAGREAAFEQSQREYWGKIEGELEVLRAADMQRAAEFAALKIEHSALRTAHQLISSALHRADPENPAIGQADEILKAVFPPDASTPADMVRQLRDIP